MSGRWSDEETADPLYADDRMFYKVEKWTAEENHITALLYAGSWFAACAGAPFHCLPPGLVTLPR